MASSAHRASSSSQSHLPLRNPQDLVGSQVLTGLDALIGQPARRRASSGEIRGAPRNLFVLLCSQLPFVVGKSAPALTLFPCCHLQQLTLRIFFPLIPDQPKHRQPDLFQASAYFSASLCSTVMFYLVVILDPSCRVFFLSSHHF